MSVAPLRPEALLKDAESLAAFPARPRDHQALSVISDGDMLRWRYGERLEDVIEDACRRHADRVAVSLDGLDVTYAELDARANQMARLLRELGLRPGDRVAVLLDRGLDCYVTLLGLLKARAAYVPIDPNHPADRLAYILEDSNSLMAVTQERFADRFPASLPLVVLERARARLDEQSQAALDVETRADPLCYVLYTSGTTGRPKGVAVAHPSICNFVRVAAENYGFGPGDRVYQGMSIAFDFSIEELWVPLVAGATLVPNASANSLFGEELAEFLESRAVTCFCCVPTLLASIERDLPNLRVFLIGGEACPPALVKRWAKPGRSLLNSYGPTETTVTATLGRMSPEKGVTIGRPLPTYSIVILDAERAEALPMGESGEIGIAGIGVAEGYLNRAELTAQKFIADFLSLPNNPSGRIYRTGDLGRINADGEIEYLGRIDTQVKLRGYRIELTEIESVLLEVEGVSQVAVATFEPAPGATELVAYYSIKHGAAAPSPADIITHLRTRLPAYMTPAYLERLPFIPMLVSNKADRAKLPKPKSAPIRVSATHAEPETALEAMLCEALKASLNLDTVSIDGDFFKEYAAHSLLMARFCARIRKSDPTLTVAMRDIYAHTTIRRLAAALTAAETQTEDFEATPAAEIDPVAYALTGAAQFAFYVVAGLCGVAAMQASFAFTNDVSHEPLALMARSALVVAAWFIALNALAIAGKWALIGRARPRTIKLWSVDYFRFWVARRLITLAPASHFAGEPLYNLFLRCLGAKIGARAVIASNIMPVAADLLEIGEDAVISRRVIATGYSAVGQEMSFGPIRVGRQAFVGEGSVLDLDTELGDFAQLAHASSLQRGQRVPSGKRYHGSPAEETHTNFRMADALTTSATRRAIYTIGQLALGLIVLGPVADAGATLALGHFGGDGEAGNVGAGALVTSLTLLPSAFTLALALYAGSLILGLAAIGIVPRLCNRFLKEGRSYRLYGFHHFMLRAVVGVSQSQFFNLLFGDSVLIEKYLRFSGVKLMGRQTTGSNFGAEQSFENPFFCEIGAGTVASDGLIMGNVQFSSHAFRIGTSRIGADSFMGTDVFVPPGARLGDNVLVGSRTLVPVDGPMREDVGLLGSPAFEIPRASTRDLEMMSRLTDAERKERLEQKTRHNLASMAMMLAKGFVVEFVGVYVFTLTVELFGWSNLWAMAFAIAGITFFSFAADILMERASLGFRRMKAQMATSYDPDFWEVERYWKLSSSGTHMQHFYGTPFRPLILRLSGAKVGRCVFDDGVIITERTLVEIGDGVAINRSVLVQPHSLEEGAYKSDFIRIGDGATLGTNSFVHYGVTLGERVRLDADAFLMKGEIAPPDTRWRGNPARMIGRRVEAAPMLMAAE